MATLRRSLHSQTLKERSVGDSASCLGVTGEWKIRNLQETRFVCETQMLPILANSKYGQGHKDKYLDTSTLYKDLVTRNAHVQYESSKFYYLNVMTNVNF